MSPTTYNTSNISRISSETTLEDIGHVLKSNGFGLNMEYKSGGYEVTINNVRDHIDYTEYSYDLLDAIQKALEKALIDKKDYKFTKDDPTIPATPKAKLSIRDISKLLSSGAETKIKM